MLVTMFENNLDGRHLFTKVSPRALHICGYLGVAIIMITHIATPSSYLCILYKAL